VQPGGKGGLATKASYFSKELNEDFLGEVFCLRNVAGHSQAKRVDPAIMSLVKLLEGHHVALSRFLRESVIRFLMRLGFGCGHVFVFGQATKILIFALLLPRSRLRIFKGAAMRFPQQMPGGSAFALNAGVMRRFQRVVALSDPKDIEFPQPQQYFCVTAFNSNRCDRVNDSPPLRLTCAKRIS